MTCSGEIERMKWLRVRKRLYQRAEAGCVEMVFTKYSGVHRLLSH